MLVPLGMNESGQLTISQSMIDGRLFSPADQTEFDNLTSRITAVETWQADKVTYLGAPIAADLVTNYNVVTTLLGVLVSALNTTNSKVNAIISGKITPIQTGLQYKNLFASS